MLNKMSVSADDHSIIRRLSRAALAATLALACILAAGQAARAADQEEEEPIETRILKAILGINDGDAIDYRERAPLVVPPSMNLVPPEQAKIDNPAWPKDADVQEKKKKKAAAKNAHQDPELAAKPLTPAELNRGRLNRPGSGPAVPENPEHEGQRPLRPGELGTKGNIFGSIFKDTSKPETAVFTGEPARSSLTAPPPGYMTPSPNQPYGLSAKKEAPKPYKLEDHGTSQR